VGTWEVSFVLDRFETDGALMFFRRLFLQSFAFDFGGAASEEWRGRLVVSL
jgi:hypothetical protein